ncbi:2OG-Fe(II)oxygenase [Diaporthe helianthi]|uniref:2OG-Fe(II)oxygenase n=1 Tax=Diaporthe helianthi TaxID=158607 RepID=A0A2P5HM15_DIAHE|nr:2OG-Fe(II)oxygenase [Diaporthe helianthi]
MARWGSDADGSDGLGSDVELESTQSSEDMISRDWKMDFFNRLASIETFGDFACMTRYSQHINPGLEVAGSLIPLPLVDRDASMIKSKCQQAPFGRGDDTVVDESVRRTWHLDASLFHCSNPAWPSFVETVLHDTTQKLGMPSRIRAVPWKLLLYEEGSFFRPHKDSEKEPGMIGTLVISLPSKHKGGEVHLSHGHMRHAFATSIFSAFDVTTLAWYSDVTHEIKPLTGGYRLVMTYNLLQQSGSAPSASVFANHKEDLQALLRMWTWRGADSTKAKIISRLEHKYSRSTLAIQYMKGRDAQISRCLQHVCQESGFHLLLAVMTRTKSEYEEDYGEGDEEYLQLDYVTDVGGKLIAKNINVEIDQILGPNPYKNRDADSEDEGEFTGNESAPSEFRYHDSALLIMPTRGLIDLLKSPSCSAADLIQMVCLPSAASLDGPPITRTEVVHFLESVLDNYGRSINEARLLTNILRACKMWSSQALYHKALWRAVREVQHNTRHQQPYQLLMPGSPITEIAEALAEHCTEFFLQPTEQEWNECLGELVHGLEASLLNKTLGLIERQLNKEELKQSFTGWRSSVETSKFVTVDVLTSLDLEFVLSLIEFHSSHDVWLSTVLLPKLSERAEKPLLYRLLHVLRNLAQREDGQFPLQDPLSLARRLLDATVPRLSLEIHDVEIETARQARGPTYLGGSSNVTGRTLGNVTDFVGLLENCFISGLKELVMQLLSNSHKNLTDGISRLAPREPRRQNTMGLRHHGPPNLLDRAPAEEFLASLDFIRAPDQAVGRFTYSKHIRSHLEAVLPSQHYRCATDTTKVPGTNCQTLVVTKIGVDTEFVEDMQIFSDKMRMYEKRLLIFRQPIVRGLIGDENYRSLIMMEAETRAISTATASNKRNASESLGPPASTRQRTGDVVDLTGE